MQTLIVTAGGRFASPARWVGVARSPRWR